MEKKTYGVGTLAYLDTFSGFIPCKVTDITPNASDLNPVRVTVVITADRRGKTWQRGEIIAGQNWWVVIPRSSVFSRCGTLHIRDNYQWKG